MSTTVCLSANTLGYAQGGGHRWVYLNWALGLGALGCRVIWLESVPLGTSPTELSRDLASLKAHLRPYGLGEDVALVSRNGAANLEDQPCLGLEAAAEADLLLNLCYGTPAAVVRRFRRSALIDIDPGLLQVWLSLGQIELPRHDLHFTIGETVGQPDARFPDAGLTWHYTPPAVALPWWPVETAEAGAAFTTVSHWQMPDWIVEGEEVYANDKRAGFLPYLDLPQHTPQALELALCFAANEEAEKASLRRRGWRVRDAWEVSGSPADYQRYIQTSRGEFSCVKPSCVRLQNAWISDRTLCYLASGKPAVVQHTGPSRFLPEADGLLRFHDFTGALRTLERVAADYEHHCQRARHLAETYFDAAEVTRRVLERALP